MTTLLRLTPPIPGLAFIIRYDSPVQLVVRAIRFGLLSALFLSLSITSAATKTDLPLPRFAAMKADEVYLRIGPGRKFPVEWVYMRRGFPIEILREKEGWRFVREIDGTEGWIHSVMLTGKRTVLIIGETMIFAHEDPDPESDIVFRAEPGVIAGLKNCNGNWCEVEIDNVSGWIPHSALWGVHSGEDFD